MMNSDSDIYLVWSEAVNFISMIFIHLKVVDMPGEAIPNHGECRKLICAICLSESGHKANRTVSETAVKLIQEYVSKGYDPEDPKFATGICEKCNVKLFKKPKQSEGRVINLHVSSRFGADLPIQTRGKVNTTSCNCTICERARMYGGSWNKFKRDSKKMDSIVLKRDEKLCPHCFSKIYRGSSHTEDVCKSKDTLVDNLSQNVDPKVLLAALKKQGKEVIETKDIPQPGPSHVYTKDDVKHLKKITGVSGKTAKTVMQFIRVKEGPGHVEPYVRENMGKDKKVFEPYFDLKRAKFQESETVPEMDKEVPVFFCHDPDGFIDKECEILGKSPDEFRKKLAVDSGKGSNKLTLTMREKAEQYETPPKKSRVTHKDTVQDIGNNKKQHVFILANFPDKNPKIGESYDNFELVFALCNLPKSKYWKEFQFTADLKAMMIALGLCTCKGVYGCPHSECYKDKNGNWVCGPRRTFSEMLILVLRFLYSGGKKNDRKKYKNCQRPPLVPYADPTECVISRCPPPGLHLFLSLNHILKGFMEQWPGQPGQPGLREWLEGHGIVFMDYFGTTLEGPECSKVLRLLDELEKASPEHCAPFITNMRHFGDVIQACFKSNDLRADYWDTINRFKASFKVLKDKFGVSETPKIHEICVHVGEWCDENQTSLGSYSEHEVESIHSTFTKVWANYRVKDIQSEAFATNWYLANMQLNYEAS